MVKSTQIIGGYEVPVADSVSLTKAAFSVDNPQIRKTDFSKSINVPATAETNKLFENLFEVQTALQTFNPNLKTDYELLIDGVQVLKGYCQLKEITETDGLTTYVLNASGLVGDLFRDIGEAELTDLTWTDMNHTWNETNVVGSWTPTLGEDYVYPMISYGDKASQQFWITDEFKPAVFLKEFIDRIFSAAGYSYDSTFFNSTRFKSLIIPGTTGRILMSDSDIEDAQFYVSRATTDQTGINGNWNDTTQMDTLIFNDDSTGDNYNTSGGDYDVATGEWDCGATKTYSFKGKLDLSFSYTPSSTGEQNFIQALCSTGLKSAYGKMHIVRTSSAVETIVDTITFDLFDLFDGATITSPFNSGDFSFSFQSLDIDCDNGDTFELRMGEISIIGALGTLANLYGTRVDFTLDIGSTFGIVLRDTKIYPGDTMTIGSTIPQKVKQKDLLNAIIKRFNLFMHFDATDDKKLIIEPLDDFVTSDKVDLNGWVDISKEKKIKPLGALKDGSFIFKDKADKDKYNEAFQAQNEHTYGFYQYDVDNDFLLNEKVVETIFAPTPLINPPSVDRIISSIEFPIDDKGYAEVSGVPKLLYWGGLLDTNHTWYLNSTTTARTTYPYAGHLDDPYDPNFDLNWGVPKFTFYDFSFGGQVDLKYTDKNCFNTYWLDYINQISNKDAKLLEVHLVLDSHRYDILSFRTQYHIDGVFWRLLEIQDFNPLSAETTRCLFIQLPEVDTFTGEQKVIFGGEGTFTSGDEQPSKGYLKAFGGGNRRGEQTLIFGDGVSTGNQSIQNSDDVLSGSGVKQTFTSGSDGAKIHSVRGGAINSPDVEIYRHGDFHVNGIPQIKRFALTLSAAVMKTLNTSPIPLQIPVASDEYIRIERGFVKIGGTAFTDSRQLHIETETSNNTLIRSETTFFLSTNATELLVHQTEHLDFGESIRLYQTSDMTGTGSDCTITLFYQIIKL